jgi:hypothetical protein
VSVGVAVTLGDGVAVAEGLGEGVIPGQNGAGSNVSPFPEIAILLQASTDPWILPLPEMCAVPRGAMNVP